MRAQLAHNDHVQPARKGNQMYRTTDHTFRPIQALIVPVIDGRSVAKVNGELTVSLPAQLNGFMIPKYNTLITIGVLEYRIKKTYSVRPAKG